MPENKKWLKPFDRIGVRLNLVIFTVLSFYLLTSSYSIITLWKQAQQFETLSHLYFERAMYASELSRNTELLSARTLEKIISQAYSTIDSDPLNENFKQFFNEIRQKLSATSNTEQNFLNDIDTLSTQYFDAIKNLDNHLFKNEKLNRDISKIKQNVVTFLENDDLNTPLSFQEATFYRAVAEIINTILLALHTESPGQSNKLFQINQSNLTKLMAIKGLSQKQLSKIKEVQKLSELTFILNKRKINQSLSILGAVRQTRLAAQRLSSACFEFYLSVKNSTQKASNTHSKLINNVIVKILIFSLAFLLLTIMSYWFIQHYLIRRLNTLSKVMSDHINGKAVEIPQSGTDEISVIARAFSIFVDSTTKAKKETEEANKKLLSLNKSLKLTSQTDHLTKIANRRHFFHELRERWKKAEKQKSNISIIMIDLDYFKSYNDYYGHQEGDRCLYQVAQILKSFINKNGGMIARYGGEEFIAVLSDINKENTYALANTLKDTVLQTAIPHKESLLGKVTISIGIATCVPDLNNDAEQLISLADKALYESKNSGRNQVSITLPVL